MTTPSSFSLRRAGESRLSRSVHRAARVQEVGQQRVVGSDVPAEQDILNGRRIRAVLAPAFLRFCSLRRSDQKDRRDFVVVTMPPKCRPLPSGKRYGDRYGRRLLPASMARRSRSPSTTTVPRCAMAPVAGPATTLPLVTSKQDPCRGTDDLDPSVSTLRSTGPPVASARVLRGKRRHHRHCRRPRRRRHRYHLGCPGFTSATANSLAASRFLSLWPLHWQRDPLRRFPPPRAPTRARR